MNRHLTWPGAACKQHVMGREAGLLTWKDILQLLSVEPVSGRWLEPHPHQVASSLLIHVNLIGVGLCSSLRLVFYFAFYFLLCNQAQICQILWRENLSLQEGKNQGGGSQWRLKVPGELETWLHIFLHLEAQRGWAAWNHTTLRDSPSEVERMM